MASASCNIKQSPCLPIPTMWAIRSTVHPCLSFTLAVDSPACHLAKKALVCKDQNLACYVRKMSQSLRPFVIPEGSAGLDMQTPWGIGRCLADKL